MADLRRNASVLAGITALDPDGQAGLLLDVPRARRRRRPVGGRPAAAASTAVELEGKAFTPGTIALWRRSRHAVDAHHRANPLRAGMPFAELATETGLGLRALEQLVAGTELVVDRDVVRTAGSCRRLDR